MLLQERGRSLEGAPLFASASNLDADVAHSSAFWAKDKWARLDGSSRAQALTWRAGYFFWPSFCAATAFASARDPLFAVQGAALVPALPRTAALTPQTFAATPTGT